MAKVFKKNLNNLARPNIQLKVIELSLCSEIGTKAKPLC